MGVRNTLTIYCNGVVDSEPCAVEFDAGHVLGEDADRDVVPFALGEARERAASAGWTSSATGDLCRRCTRLAGLDDQVLVSSERIAGLYRLENLALGAARRGVFGTDDMLSLRDALGEERWRLFASTGDQS